MKTIRERDAEFSGIPDMTPLTGPDSAQVRAYDRGSLLAAGDALAEVAAGGEHLGTGYMAGCPVCAALAVWKAATG